MTRVLVTGGNGGLGSEVVPRLLQAGCTVRVMSRKSSQANRLPAAEWAQANLETGQGILEAVSDIDVIVHAATSVIKHTRQVDVEGTRMLLERARAAGVSHVIYISIVGIDRIPFA